MSKKRKQILEGDKETPLHFGAGFLRIITALTKHTLGLSWMTNTVLMYFPRKAVAEELVKTL